MSAKMSMVVARMQKMKSGNLTGSQNIINVNLRITLIKILIVKKNI